MTCRVSNIGTHKAKEHVICSLCTYLMAEGDAGRVGLRSFCVAVVRSSWDIPKIASEKLIAEAARVLRPGGVFGYFDLNPVQMLRDNSVSNIVDRVAISNEPFMDEFLAFDLEATLKANGLELVQVRSSNTEKWPKWQDCSVRIVIAKRAKIEGLLEAAWRDSPHPSLARKPSVE